MKHLLDTQLLLWIAEASPRLPRTVQLLIADQRNELLFSVASMWEVAIKNAKGSKDFQVDPGDLRAELLLTGYRELPISGAHVVAISSLPPIHKDPFDRLLVAQAIVEGITLLTADKTIARYPGPIRKV